MALRLRLVGTLLGVVVLPRYLHSSWLLCRGIKMTTGQHNGLDDSHAQLQVVFDLIEEGMVFLDWDRNIARMNLAAADLLGLEARAYSSQELGNTFDVFLPSGELLPPDQWPSSRALLGDFLRNAELHIRRRDTGATEIVEISTAPIEGKSRQSPHIAVSYKNVTTPRRLAQARLYLADIVDSSEDAIIGKDLSGIVTSWNRGAEKVFGYTAEEMVGSSIRRLLPAGQEEQEDLILRRIRRGDIVNHLEEERITKDGKTITVSLTISPIRDAGGTIVGASKIARDISERKQLEQQLRQSQKMEAVGQLTGGIAHDFNNLLAVVIGNLDLLEGLVSHDAAALKRVQVALKGALRGADLTKKLLSFSSKGRLTPKSASINDCISNLVEFASRAIGPEISLVTRIGTDLPPLLIDVALFESALLNLVVNARDAMPKGGTLTVTAERRYLEANYPPVLAGELIQGTYACVRVSDTGHGMSKDVLERAFEPFFTTKDLDRGTGLGLAMVYSFAKKSCGTVRIYSEVGYGTTVSLYLPFSSCDEPISSAQLEEVDVERYAGSVLLVDDEEDLLDIANQNLEEMGFTVYQARNAQDALKLLDHRPDIGLMITDVIMPGGMNGVELASKVREARPDIRVVYCSGFPVETLAENSMPLVDGPLLHKPYQRHQFRKIIEQVTTGRPH